jgi:hypothetical protein
MPSRLLPSPRDRPQTALRLEGASDLLNPPDDFPFGPVLRQTAGDQMNGVPPRRQPGALLEQHPFGTADHVVNRYVSDHEQVHGKYPSIKPD